MKYVLSIYNFLKIGQDVLKVLVPALEVIISKDLNRDGKIG